MAIGLMILNIVIWVFITLTIRSVRQGYVSYVHELGDTKKDYLARPYVIQTWIFLIISIILALFSFAMFARMVS